MPFYKRKIHQKILQKMRPKNQFQVLLSLQKTKYNFYWKTKILKQATYIKYVIAKLSKFVQISMLTFSESFLQRVLRKLIRAWNQFLGHIFHIIFDKKICFVILHQLAKFHYQAVFISQVIQQYVFRVSCVGI